MSKDEAYKGLKAPTTHHSSRNDVHGEKEPRPLSSAKGASNEDIDAVTSIHIHHSSKPTPSIRSSHHDHRPLSQGSPTQTKGQEKREKNPKAPKDKAPFGPRPAVFPSTPREILFILIATIATATASFLQGASSIITSSIGLSLNMTQAQITWITASTSLTAGAFQLGLGQLADFTGRKSMFIAGLGSFSAFSLLVAFAKNAYWMDIVSGILGISSAMVVPPAIGIMGAAYDRPSKRKNLAFSAFSAGNPLGFVFGSVLSGVTTRLFERPLGNGGRDSWRAAYVIVAVLWAGFAVLAVWGVPGGDGCLSSDGGTRKRRKGSWGGRRRGGIPRDEQGRTEQGAVQGEDGGFIQGFRLDGDGVDYFWDGHVDSGYYARTI